MGKSTEVALSYCAGFIDGEGCISIVKTDQRKKSNNVEYYYSRGFRLFLNMSITDSTKSLDYLVGALGGKTYVHARKTNMNRQVFSWYCDGNRALTAIKKILPYLIIKKQEAILGIEFQNHINRNKVNTYRYGREYLYEERKEMYYKMKELKKNRADVEHNSSENESSSDVPNQKEILET